MDRDQILGRYVQGDTYSHHDTRGLILQRDLVGWSENENYNRYTNPDTTHRHYRSYHKGPTR